MFLFEAVCLKQIFQSPFLVIWFNGGISFRLFTSNLTALLVPRTLKESSIIYFGNMDLFRALVSFMELMNLYLSASSVKLICTTCFKLYACLLVVIASFVSSKYFTCSLSASLIGSPISYLLHNHSMCSSFKKCKNNTVCWSLYHLLQVSIFHWAITVYGVF